jgi:uncharacterized protein YutE (UPF0331/DUF86 family)
MVDRDLLLRRLALLETYLGQLAQYRSIDANAYRADWRTQRVIERTLHLAIEACMDVADHVVADRRLRVPETGASRSRSSPRRACCRLRWAAALASMVGFRNILVHDYARIDPAIVVRVLRSDLADVERFLDTVRALL